MSQCVTNWKGTHFFVYEELYLNPMMPLVIQIQYEHSLSSQSFPHDSTA